MAWDDRAGNNDDDDGDGDGDGDDGGDDGATLPAIPPAIAADPADRCLDSALIHRTLQALRRQRLLRKTLR
jgi:hypothetical protein